MKNVSNVIMSRFRLQGETVKAWAEGHDLKPDTVYKTIYGSRGRQDPWGVGAPLLLRYSDHIRGSGPEAVTHACRFDLGGIVSERADSECRPGKRDFNSAFGRREEEWGKRLAGYNNPS